MTKWLNKQQMQHSFNAAAQTYDQAAGLQREVGDLLLKHILELDLSNKTIIDLGSGTGYLSQRLQQDHIISVDIAENMLQFSKQRYPLQPYLCSDAENLCFQNNSVDIIISNMALHWCQNISKMLNELNRILKPGGQCLFTILGEKSLNELQQCWSMVDQHRHVNRFPSIADIRKDLSTRFSKTDINASIITQHHDSIYTLMKKLKDIGAHNVTTEKPKGLTGRKKLQALEKAYETFRTNKKTLPATYEIILGVCKK